MIHPCTQQLILEGLAEIQKTHGHIDPVAARLVITTVILAEIPFHGQMWINSLLFEGAMAQDFDGNITLSDEVMERTLKIRDEQEEDSTAREAERFLQQLADDRERLQRASEQEDWNQSN